MESERWMTGAIPSVSRGRNGNVFYASLQALHRSICIAKIDLVIFKGFSGGHSTYLNSSLCETLLEMIVS